MAVIVLKVVSLYFSIFTSIQLVRFDEQEGTYVLTTVSDKC